MIAYHREEITRDQFLEEYNNKKLWEKQDETICNELQILLDSQKTMDFSKFLISMN